MLNTVSCRRRKRREGEGYEVLQLNWGHCASLRCLCCPEHAAQLHQRRPQLDATVALPQLFLHAPPPLQADALQPAALE